MFSLGRNLCHWFGFLFGFLFDNGFRFWLGFRVRLRLRMMVRLGLQYLNSFQKERLRKLTVRFWDFQFGETVAQLLVLYSDFETFHARHLQRRYTGCVGPS